MTKQQGRHSTLWLQSQHLSAVLGWKTGMKWQQNSQAKEEVWVSKIPEVHCVNITPGLQCNQKGEMFKDAAASGLKAPPFQPNFPQTSWGVTLSKHQQCTRTNKALGSVRTSEAMGPSGCTEVVAKARSLLWQLEAQHEFSQHWIRCTPVTGGSRCCSASQPLFLHRAIEKMERRTMSC